MLFTDEKCIASKVKFWATQSRENFLHYEHKEIGYNYRLSNISAGIGRGQLKALETRVDKKRELYNRYKEAFKDLADITLMNKHDKGEPNYWLSVMTINEKSTIKPKDVIETLVCLVIPR